LSDLENLIEINIFIFLSEWEIVAEARGKQGLATMQTPSTTAE
jgi:hypothetical protein